MAVWKYIPLWSDIFNAIVCLAMYLVLLCGVLCICMCSVRERALIIIITYVISTPLNRFHIYIFHAISIVEWRLKTAKRYRLNQVWFVIILYRDSDWEWVSGLQMTTNFLIGFRLSFSLAIFALGVLMGVHRLWRLHIVYICWFSRNIQQMI